MDPKANIERQLTLAQEIQQLLASIALPLPAQASREEVADRMGAELRIELLAGELAQLVQDLDEWRRNGGFDPYGPTDRQVLIAMLLRAQIPHGAHPEGSHVEMCVEPDLERLKGFNGFCAQFRFTTDGALREVWIDE